MTFLKSIDPKKAASWVGAVLMAASLFFIVRQIMSMWQDIDLSILADAWVLTALLGLVLVEGSAIILASINYRILIKNVSGITVERPLATVVYMVSNLYKYIPSGVMFVLGRNRMALETQGLSHGKVLLATVLEGVFAAVAALILSGVLIFDYVIYYFYQLDIWPMVGLALGIAALIVLPVLYLFRRRIQAYFSTLKTDTEVLRPTVLLKRLAFGAVPMGLSTISFTVTLTLLGQPMTLGLGITVMGLFILSWLAGFLAPGVPSGIGVREAVLLMFLAGTLNEGILLSAVILHRVLTVVGDVMAYGAVLGYARMKKSAEG
ncbi:MAG: hypothetical protein FWD99_03375 [Oscillospiraceae bacterium]|nr:hypothetical protein [Oscillospiraceae bacterium]